MATKIRPELSKKNDFWLSKHRYYELKHYCLQYPEWKRQLANLSGLSKNGTTVKTKNSNIGDPTGSTAIMVSDLKTKIKEIDDAAKKADVVLAEYIVKAVTEDRSYNYLNTYLNMPCGRDSYYKIYRKFFSLLDKSHK